MWASSWDPDPVPTPQPCPRCVGGLLHNQTVQARLSQIKPLGRRCQSGQAAVRLASLDRWRVQPFLSREEARP